MNPVILIVLIVVAGWICFRVWLLFLRMILGLYLINFLNIDLLDEAKTDDFRRLIENKMVEKNILLHYSARRIAKKIPEENFEHSQQKNEVINEIEKIITEIGENNSVDNMPLGSLVFYGDTQEAPKELRNEINTFLKQQKKYRRMLRIFNFVDQA